MTSRGNGERPRGAVVVAGGSAGLAVLRSLARCGVDLALVTDEADDLTLHSRACGTGHVVRLRPDGEALAGFLEDRAAEWRGRVLLPTSDDALEGLARHRELLERWYRVPVPSLDAISSLLSKEATQRIGEELGIDMARSYGRADRTVLEREDIAFPVVVKPLESRPFVRRFGVKLFVARDRAELARAIDDFAAAEFAGLVLDHIPGDDSHLYHYAVYVDARGEPTAEQAMRKLRASPPFYGVSRVVEPVTAPAMREPTISFLEKIRWRGIAEACYKLDPRDGRFRLLEINGRFFTQQGLSHRCGLDYAGIAWAEAAMGQRPRAEDNGWRGVWVDLHDDIYYGLFHRRTEGLSVRDYLAPYRRPLTHSVWSARDPRPFAAQWRQALRRFRSAKSDGAAWRDLGGRVQAMPR